MKILINATQIHTVDEIEAIFQTNLADPELKLHKTSILWGTNNTTAFQEHIKNWNKALKSRIASTAAAWSEQAPVALTNKNPFELFELGQDMSLAAHAAGGDFVIGLDRCVVEACDGTVKLSAWLDEALQARILNDPTCAECYAVVFTDVEMGS